MNSVAIFSNSRFGDIRTIDEQGKVYFCGKDIATALGYTNAKDAVSRHCVPKGVVKHDLLTNGGKQKVNFIDEGNLYRLITHSKLPDAEKFESWVFDEVLPTIRKTGGYISNEDTFIKNNRLLRNLFQPIIFAKNLLKTIDNYS